MLSRLSLLTPLCVLLLGLAENSALAQPEFNFPPEIFLPETLEPGTTINVSEGGFVSTIGGGPIELVDGEINVDGGSIGEIDAQDSVINVTNGRLFRFDFLDSTFNATGATIGSEPVTTRSTFENSTATIFDTTFNSDIRAVDSELNFTRSVLRFTDVRGSSAQFQDSTIENLRGTEVTLASTVVGQLVANEVHFHGGRISDDVSVDELILYGDEFQIDGSDISLADSTPLPTTERRLLTGVLEDGSVIVINERHNIDTITLIRSELPIAETETIRLTNDLAIRSGRREQTLVVDQFILSPIVSLGTLQIENGGAPQDAVVVGGLVEINGGNTGLIKVYEESLVRQTDGHASNIQLRGGSHYDLSGGSVRDIHAFDQSTIDFQQGAITNNLTDAVRLENSEFTASGGIMISTVGVDNGTISLLGNNFLLNGVPVSELTEIGDEHIITSNGTHHIEGTLSDGSPISLTTTFSSSPVGPFNRDGRGTIRLVASELPASSPVARSSVDQIPDGINIGQTLIVDTDISAPLFYAARNSTLVIEPGGSVGADIQGQQANIQLMGGTIGGNLLLTDSDVTVQDGSQVNEDISMNGGSLSVATNSRVTGINTTDAEVTITGGTTDGARINGGSLSVSGGAINVTSANNSEINIHGGTVDALSRVTNSTLQISGGSVGDVDLHISRLTLVGGEFSINGLATSGTQTPGSTVDVQFELGDVLSGTLSDGTPFAISDLDNADRIRDTTVSLLVAELPQVVPGPVLLSEVTHGIRNGQELRLEAGDALPSHFSVGPNGLLRVDGGDAGSDLEVIGGHVVVNDGVLGDGFDVFNEGLLQFLGGESRGGQIIGGTFEISSGQIDQIAASNNAKIQINGGETGELNAVDSIFEMAGGTIDTLRTTNSDAITTGGVIEETWIEGNAIDLANTELGSGPYVQFQRAVFDNVISGNDGRFTGPTQDSSLTVRNSQLGSSLIEAGTLEIQDSQIIGGDFKATNTLVIRGSEIGFGDFESPKVLIASSSITSSSIRFLSDSDVRAYGADLRVVDVFPATLFIAEGRIASSERSERPVDFDGSSVTMLDGELPESISDFTSLAIAGNRTDTRFEIGDNELHLVGTEFYVDGVPLPGLESPGDSIVLNELDGELSGAYLSGATFSQVFGNAPEHSSLRDSGELRLSLGIEADFNLDLMRTVEDIDILFEAIREDSTVSLFDLTQDDNLTITDADAWLTIAGTSRGDANLDGAIGFDDFLALSANFGQSGGWSDGNFDGDNDVTFVDFLILSAAFSNPQELTTVPEPENCCVALACTVLVIRLRRRRKDFRR